jgi:5'-3' exonuclease
MPTYGPTLRLPELEADDLVALTVRRIRALRPQQPLYIYANDRDYLQLHRYPAVHLIEGAGKEIACAPEGGEFELWKKVLMGDKSDNIPPVARGIGVKTAEKLARDPEARTKIEAQHPETYRRNRDLVDFDAIPEALVARFDAARVFGV